MNGCNRPAARAAPATQSLARPIALLDISKPGGNVFLDRIEELLRSATGGERDPRDEADFCQTRAGASARSDPGVPTR